MENDAQQPDDDGGEDMIGLVPKPVASKRQKKKLKQMQSTERNKDKEIEKTVAYLTKWNLYRDEWKYEKLRQIFVQKNVFDEKVFDEEQCRIAIDYLATSKVIRCTRFEFRIDLLTLSIFRREPHAITLSRKPKRSSIKSMRK